MTSTPDILRIAIAQLNPTMGDIAGNLRLAREARADAARQQADLVFFTELFISGYPPEDLVLKPAFMRDCRKAVEALAADTGDGGPGVIIGTPWQDGDLLHNAVAVLDGGRITAWRAKVDLPNYGEFDEKRVFQAGPMPGPVNFRGTVMEMAGRGRETHPFALEVGTHRGQIGYPTLVILDAENNKLITLPGYYNAERLEPILVYYAEGYHKELDFETFRGMYSPQGKP